MEGFCTLPSLWTFLSLHTSPANFISFFKRKLNIHECRNSYAFLQVAKTFSSQILEAVFSKCKEQWKRTAQVQKRSAADQLLLSCYTCLAGSYWFEWFQINPCILPECLWPVLMMRLQTKITTTLEINVCVKQDVFT